MDVLSHSPRGGILALLVIASLYRYGAP